MLIGELPSDAVHWIRNGWPAVRTDEAVGAVIETEGAPAPLPKSTVTESLTVCPRPSSTVTVKVWTPSVVGLTPHGAGEFSIGVPPLSLTLFGWGVTGSGNDDLWPVAWALLMLTLLFIQRFRHSRLGTSALMVQMNPDLAQALGVDARAVRFLVFIASAPISALAGWLYAYQRAYVGPDMFESYFLVLMLTAIVVVGRRLLLGPLIGTALIIVQQTFFSIGGDGDKIVLGAVLAAILLLFPKGMIGVWDAAAVRLRAYRH